MNSKLKWSVYRAVLKLTPKHGKIIQSDLPEQTARSLEKILKKHRTYGAALICHEDSGTGSVYFGSARYGQAVPVTPDTVFRIASVSKLVCAVCALRLHDLGLLSLDADTDAFLPFSLRHPDAPDTPVTLRMLLTHTAGIRDNALYFEKAGTGYPLSELIRSDCHTAHLPGQKWEYSNLGGGLVGVIMEQALHADFESILQRYLFGPLEITAAWQPQRVTGPLADCVRVLPPVCCYDAEARRKKPVLSAGPDHETHYTLSQGNLCISAPELAKLMPALLSPGFLSEESLACMRHAVLPFGERADNLSQGVGTFILEDASIAPRPLYGHQGMAYGAVNMLFYDPVSTRWVLLLTTGADESRHGVLADLNRDVLRFLWKR